MIYRIHLDCIRHRLSRAENCNFTKDSVQQPGTYIQQAHISKSVKDIKKLNASLIAECLVSVLKLDDEDKHLFIIQSDVTQHLNESEQKHLSTSESELYHVCNRNILYSLTYFNNIIV